MINRMSRLRHLYRYVLPYWLPMTAAALMLLLSSLINLALPWVVRLLVDNVFVDRNLDQLNQLGLGLFGLFGVQGLFMFGHTYLLTFSAQRVVADLRASLQQHLTLLPLQFYDERHTGEMVSRLTNDVAVIQATLTDNPIQFLRQVVTFAGGLVLMLTINAPLTLLVFVLLPPVIAFALFFGRRLQRLSKVIQDRLADATTVLEETLSGVRVVKSFTQEGFEQARYKNQIEAAFQSVMQRTRLRAIFIPLINMLGFGSIVLIVWVGGQQVIANLITPGDLIAFLFYALMVTGPLGEAAGIYSQLREALGASERIFEILASPHEPLDRADAQPLPEVNGQIRFEGVSFAYPGGELVLDDIHLEVLPAQVVALVGASGVGKTTFVNLISRFYDPVAGKIYFDGIDIRQAQLRQLRQKIGLVPQDTFLFGGTIRENIGYGKPGATLAEIRLAAAAAYASDFIDQLPQGYETITGERRVKLSTGQRQRIAIARALLKNPRILILDEATSALDSESERFVQSALERLMDGRTTFIIAHRLSTIQRADRILVLHGGKIIEDGNHMQLMALEGIYFQLWQYQFADSPPLTNA